MEEKIILFWFRRDLRLTDNAGLQAALSTGWPVLPLFVFDTEILGKLPSPEDARVGFIHRELEAMKSALESAGSTLLVFHGTPSAAFDFFTERYAVHAVYCNRDYEPYGIARDQEISKFLQKRGISFFTSKDHVIFEKEEVLKEDGTPYTVFTPYSRKWKSLLRKDELLKTRAQVKWEGFLKTDPYRSPALKELGFRETGTEFPSRSVSSRLLENYENTRDYPGVEGTTRLGVHLRFGTVSIRSLVLQALEYSPVFLNELIWRDFFISILAHFPYVEKGPFKKQYGYIAWLNDETAFDRWCRGETGYPMVDAGMRQLNATGFMHNRIRMITASFLAKHLLIDWRWGEAWFAAKLLDFDLASNNGNWQWAAGCGCDAAPYFRVFNPEIQQKKFDPQGAYVHSWVPEAGTASYPAPMVDHSFARDRALAAYKKGVSV